MGIFEEATQRKLRWESNKGLLDVEQLWDLPLTSNSGRINLDDMAMGINNAIKDMGQAESFVTKRTRINRPTELRLEILKRIIEVKLEERDAKVARKARLEEIEKIKEVLAEKEEGAMKSKSKTALEKRLKELQES